MNKRILSLLLVLILAVSLIPAAFAASVPAVSSNIDDHFYINAQRFAPPICSALSYEDGGFLRVEAIGSSLVVERYDSGFRFLSGQEIPLELPVYGGVYICDDYNFLLVGQENFEEDDAKEVFRIIRYTKDWQKVDHASIYGANTTIPFDAGCARFDRCGNMLYIRTSHEMYTSEDGLNHQANVMIAVRISDMTVTDQLSKVWNSGYGYVSHSFNQFVRVDGDTLLAVDHGDYYPRSIALFRYPNSAASETFYGRTTMVNALPIVDSTYHYNDTGVSVGGFEFSSTHYLIAGCSYDQVETANLMNVHRNIFITATPKDDFTDEATQVHWLTHYTQEDDVTVSPPHLLKLDTDRFFLTWTENGILKYCLLDGSGQLDGEILTGEGHLSDCAPILVGTRGIWYVTDSSAPVFYEIDLDPHTHSYTAEVTAPTCTAGGFTTYTCTGCGDSFVDDPVGPLGHAWEGLSCTRCSAHREHPFEDVPSDSWYNSSVVWAISKNITQGTSSSTFAPDETCTRAQVVTFLWRSAGCPAPITGENPFSDVKETDWFYEAVLWAVENDITVGIGGGKFGTEDPCTRAQVATFLWRSAGQPAHSIAENPFIDLTEDWYVAPVLWAFENRITQGDGAANTFNPGGECTRAQIVTFLYRYMG